MQAPAEGENIELLGGADLDVGNGDQVLSVSVDDLVDKLGWGAYQNRLMFQCGVFWSADAVEVMVMSIALHSIKEQWLLSDYEASFIPLVTFAGLLFGAPCWGIISDRRGRRFGYFLSAVMMGLFGVLSALCPGQKFGFYFFLVLRLIVGFAVGGGSAGYALFCELVGACMYTLPQSEAHMLADSVSGQRQKIADCNGSFLVGWYGAVRVGWLGHFAQHRLAIFFHRLGIPVVAVGVALEAPSRVASLPSIARAVARSHRIVSNNCSQKQLPISPQHHHIGSSRSWWRRDLWLCCENPWQHSHHQLASPCSRLAYAFQNPQAVCYLEHQCLGLLWTDFHHTKNCSIRYGRRIFRLSLHSPCHAC